MKLIEIDGPSAVGKTSISKLIIDYYNGNFVNEILIDEKSPFKKFNDEESFLKNQIWIFEKYYNRLNKLDMNKDLYFIDIGLIEILTFSKYYPVIKKIDWNITKEFLNIIQNFDLTKPIAYIIIYLNASEENLKLRKTLDTSRLRSHHSENIEISKYQKEHLENLKKIWSDRIYFLDANKEKKVVLEDVKKIIDTAKPNTKPITIGNLVEEIFCL